MLFHFSEIIFIVGFVAYIVIRGVFGQRSKEGRNVIKQVRRGEVVVILVMTMGSMLLPIVYLLTPLLAFADYTLPTFAPYAGTVIMLAALWLFWKSHADLAENWSLTLEMREGHKLVTHGVYRSVRHPMYSAICLFSIAQGLLLHNWLAGWSALAGFVVLYLVRVGNEEHMMAEYFGQEYSDYVSKTGRLFPKIRR